MNNLYVYKALGLFYFTDSRIRLGRESPMSESKAGVWPAYGSAIAAGVATLSGMIYAWHYRGSTATAITGLSLALVTCALAIKGWLGTALELSAVMTGATLILLGGVVTHQFGEF